MATTDHSPASQPGNPNTGLSATSKGMRWTGYVLSALIVFALLFSAYMKFVIHQSPDSLSKEDLENFTKLKWESSLLVLAILEISCTIIYAIPQTSVLGAILLTGYLGGAVATHVRISDNFAPPLIMGVLAWLGLFLRDRRLWALLPLRK